jgi:hypothetical protein
VLISSLTGPGKGLVVSDSTGTLSRTAFTGNPSQVLRGDGSFGTAGFWQPGTANKIYYNSGKVGIGTATPNFRLDVNGDMRVSQNLYLQGQLVISEKIETPKEMRARSMKADSIILDSTKGIYGLARFEGDVELSQKLEVDGSVLVGGALKTLGSLTFAGNKSLQYVPAAGSEPALLDFGTSLGTGTGSAVACLSGRFGDQALNRFEGIIQTFATTSFGNRHSLSMGVNGTDAMIETSGLAGDPSVQDPRLLINYSCGRDVLICTGAQGNVYMASGGSVGIGEEYVPSGYKLAVKGKVITEEVFVALRSSWPDYVFSSEYKMLTLPELGSFITKRKHLPGLPPAAIINTAGGYELGDTQLKLIEKIEEQTLYILQLHDRISALENEMESQTRNTDKK